MGYYVEMIDSDFVLEKKDHPEILKIWKELNDPKNNHLKKGEAYGRGSKILYHYSFMATNYDQICESVEDVLEQLRFEFDIQKDQSIKLTGFSSKAGQAGLFLDKISQFVKDSSYIDWEGEDGEKVSWVFSNKKMTEILTFERVELNNIKYQIEYKNNIKENVTEQKRELKYKI